MPRTSLPTPSATPVVHRPGTPHSALTSLNTPSEIGPNTVHPTEFTIVQPLRSGRVPVVAAVVAADAGTTGNRVQAVAGVVGVQERPAMRVRLYALVIMATVPLDASPRVHRHVAILFRAVTKGRSHTGGHTPDGGMGQWRPGSDG